MRGGFFRTVGEDFVRAVAIHTTRGRIVAGMQGLAVDARAETRRLLLMAPRTIDLAGRLFVIRMFGGQVAVTLGALVLAMHRGTQLFLIDEKRHLLAVLLHREILVAVTLQTVFVRDGILRQSQSRGQHQQHACQDRFHGGYFVRN